MGKSNKLTTGAGRLARLEESRLTETDLKISAGRLGRSELKLLEYTGKKKVAPSPFIREVMRGIKCEPRPPSRLVQKLRNGRNDAPEPTRSSTRRVGSWQMEESFQDEWVLRNKIMDL